MSHIQNGIFKNWLIQWVFVLVLGVIIHIPHFAGSHLFFDGDEAILGIMTHDFITGKSFPIFFYGQNYGFATPEVLFTAPFMLIFGKTVLTLKLGALALYSVGVVFMSRLFKVTGLRWFIGIFLLVTFGPWLLWSIKLRGGYVTAFTCSSIIFYLLQAKGLNKWKWLMVISIAGTVLLHSQMIIGIPIFIYLIWTLMSQRHLSIIKKIFPFLFMIMLYFLILLAGKTSDSVWQPAYSNEIHWSYLKDIFRHFPQTFFGHYYYEMTFKADTFLVIVFILALIAGFYSVIMGWRQLGKNNRMVLIVLFIGSLFALFPALMMGHLSYRYLLGFYTGALLCWTLLLRILLAKRRYLHLVVMVLCTLPGIFIVSRTPATWAYQDGNDLVLWNELVSELERREVEHVYATSPLLQWQLNYFDVNARFIFNEERTSKYVNAVDQCNENSDCKVAIVGFKGICLGMDAIPGWHDEVIYINERFFIFPNPERSQLEIGGYEF